MKRFLDSRSVEERNQIYKYLQDSDRTKEGEENKSKQKKSSGMWLLGSRLECDYDFEWNSSILGL